MTRVQFGVVAVLLAVIAGAEVSSALGRHDNKPAADHVQKFEYKIESPSDDNLREDMTRAGAAGWDLVSARRAIGEGRSASYEFIYRRAK